MTMKNMAAKSLAFALVAVLTLGCSAFAATTPSTLPAVIETPGVLLARQYGLGDNMEVIGLTNGADENGRGLIFVLYTAATDVFGGTNSPVYMKNIGIAAIHAAGKIVKEDSIIGGGYSPTMINVGLDPDGTLGTYLLVSAPTGGSGGTSTFKLMRYHKGAWSELLGKDASLPVTGSLNNYYRATVRVPEANIAFSYTIPEDLRSMLISDGRYDETGRVVKNDPDYIWTDGFVSILPYIAGNDMVLMVQEAVYGGHHANTIAQIHAIYRLNAEGTGLDLGRVSVYDMNDKLLTASK